MAYVRTPLEPELRRIYDECGGDRYTMAAVIGCHPTSIPRALAKIGLHAVNRPMGGAPAHRLRLAPLRDRVVALELRVADLEEALRVAWVRSNDLRDLIERVQALESRPVPVRGGLVEWRPDHRRQADGGRPVRAQRKAVGLPKRPKAVA